MSKKKLLRKLNRQDARISHNFAFVKRAGARASLVVPVQARPEPVAEIKRGRKGKKHETAD